VPESVSQACADITRRPADRAAAAARKRPVLSAGAGGDPGPAVADRPDRPAQAAQTSHVRVVSSGDVVAVGPGGVFVVEGAVSEAAVEDGDEPVGHDA